MASIPASINGVAVSFGDGIVNDVVQTLVNGLQHCIKPNITAGFVLQTVYISAVKDHHTAPSQVNSRHNQRKGVNISRINGQKIAIGYPGTPATKAIVDAIQESFETYAGRRENFGPHLKKKLGQNWIVSGHNDHIHLSVN